MSQCHALYLYGYHLLVYHFKLGADNQPERVGGVKYTIKDGIVFDAKALLSDVRKIVRDAKPKESGNSARRE